MTLLDVIIPGRGECPWLEAALSSIATQTLLPDTVWLVDDGLTAPALADGIGQRLFGARYRRIANRGSGISGALNTAVAVSEATWVARMDTDDVAHPTRFEEQIRALSKARSDCMGCGGQVRLIDERGVGLGTGQYPTSWQAIQPQLLKRSCFAHPSLVMRRRVLEAIPYRSALDGAEDVDLLLRLSKLGSLFNLDTVLLDYRIHVGQENFVARARQTALQELAFRLHLCCAGGGEDPVAMNPSLPEAFIAWRLEQPGYAPARRAMTAVRYLPRFIGGRNAEAVRRCTSVLLAAHPWRPSVWHWMARVHRDGPGSLVVDPCPWSALNPGQVISPQIGSAHAD